MYGMPQVPCHCFHWPLAAMSSRMNLPGGAAEENPCTRESVSGPGGLMPEPATCSAQPWYIQRASGPSARCTAPYAAFARARKVGSGGSGGPGGGGGGGGAMCLELT